MVRIKNKQTFWRRMVRGHARSGESVRAYCRRHHLSEPSFYWWRRELARRDITLCPRSEAPAKPPAFVPVVMPQTAAVEPIVVELRSGRMLRLPMQMPVAQVAELIRAIECELQPEAAS